MGGRTTQVTLGYVVCFLFACGSARPNERASARSLSTASWSLALAVVSVVAQIVFQISYGISGDEPQSWMLVFGWRTFSNGTAMRTLFPDVLVIFTSLWARGEITRRISALQHNEELRSTSLSRALRRATSQLFGVSEEELKVSGQKWWRLLGFVCCVATGFSENGALQYTLLIASLTRFIGGRGDVRLSRWTRFQHSISTTGKMQLFTGSILIGSYGYTALCNTSRRLEDSKVANVIGFWTLGQNGKICCMSAAQATGVTFAFLANACFAAATSYGDSDASFTFRELMGFSIRRGMYRPLLYAPFVAVAVTFTGMSNIKGFSMSLVQTVDILTVLSTTLRTLASARSLVCKEELGSFPEKWLVRLRDTLRRYIAFQYLYISVLYIWNIPTVYEAVTNAWPVSLRRHITPYDFGLFQTSALASWKHLYHRYLTIALCVVLHYWLEERTRTPEDGDESDSEAYVGNDTPVRRLEIETSPRKKRKGINEIGPVLFMYQAFACMIRHVLDSLGDKFESALHHISMELLLLVATICVAFRVEFMSLLYIVVIMFACIELAVPTVRGKAPRPLLHGAFSFIGTVFRVFTDAWAYFRRLHRRDGDRITAADMQVTPPREASGWFSSGLRQSDFKHSQSMSIHTEVNDYGFFLALIAVVSIMLKQITLLSVFQSGALNALVNKSWGSWLGLISLYDPRMGDDLGTATSCCAWPYVFDAVGTFCYDARLSASSSNQFSPQACLNFGSNWYIFGAHYAVIIFAVLHGFLQRRHNFRVQTNTKAATAKAVPRASYWAKLRGEVRGCDVAKKLKLLIISERIANATPQMKKRIATDEGFSPVIQRTPIQADEDVFADLSSALVGRDVQESSARDNVIKHNTFGWRAFVVRLVHRFVHWDLKSMFETLDSAMEQLGSLKYLLAMAVLLINAFLKSDVTSSIYILILGYFLAFNNRDGIVRFQSQGYAILLVIGAIFTVHVLAALRLPTVWLSTNYCESCPEKRFWLDVGTCPTSVASPPPPAAPVSAYLDCNSRPVFVQQYEIVSDILVMLLIGHYVRRGHKNMVRDDVRTAWMRGYMRAKGKQMGENWVNTEQFTRLAEKVNKRLAERRKLDETAELSFNEKIKRWDGVAAQLAEYVPVPANEEEREVMRRAEWTSRRLSRQVSHDAETSAIVSQLNFATIIKMAHNARENSEVERSEILMTHYFHKLFYKYLIMIIVILTYVAAVSQRKSDLISLGYAAIAIVFTTRYDGLRINTRTFPKRRLRWWNGELFRILPTYVFVVLTAKLLYQIPYVKPKLLSGATALLGSCVEGTRMCETINSLFGIRKVGSACDASMIASDCVPVLAFRSGSIGVDVVLFILCSIQTQLFSDERYVREVLRLEKQELDKMARRSLLYRKHVLGWRAKIREQMDDEYETITEKVRQSAAQATEWTQFQRFQKSIAREDAMEKYIPQDVVATVKSPTSVEVTWRMDSAAHDLEQFTIKRERSPRVTIFPHFVNPIKVEVDPESPHLCSHMIENLNPGVSYTFLVQSCSKSHGYGPPSKPSTAVKMPDLEVDEDKTSVTRNVVVVGLVNFFGVVTNAASYFLDPVLYPLRQADKGDDEWVRKGDWGDAGIVSRLGKLIYSQSEPLAYISLILNFIDHMDLMSAGLILFIITFAALWNPHPSPETWRSIFWYAVAVFFVRLSVQSRIVCMQLNGDASSDDRNKWYISIQPFCPSTTLYDPHTDSLYSTVSATLLTVPRGRSMIRDEVWTDIFFLTTLVLHISRMTSVGQRTEKDTRFLAPREDYEDFHERARHKDDGLATFSVATPTSPRRRSRQAPVPSSTETVRRESSHDSNAQNVHSSRRRRPREKGSSFRRKVKEYIISFGHVGRFAISARKSVTKLVQEVCLSDSLQKPARNVGKPGIDLHALEMFLQLIISLWFVCDYSNLVFDAGKALSSTESFGTGLTVSIASSVAWMILNRLVYLKQNVKAKLFLHVSLSVLYVSLVFLFLPLCDTRAYMSPRHNQHLKWFTAFVLAHFVVGAMQLREGFREGSQFKLLIMRFGITPVGRFLYNVVNIIPFLFEMRTLLDWSASDTSMDFIMWFRYETLFYILHRADVVLAFRKNSHQMYSGAQPFPKPMKILLGGGMIAIIVLLLTGPVFIFSTFNPALASNRVESATLHMQLDVVADGKNERHMLYDGFATGYAMDSASEDALKDALLSTMTYRSIDSDCVRFPRYSESAWILPTNSRLELAQRLNSTALTSTCVAEFSFSTKFTRNGPPKSKTVQYDFASSLSNAKCVELAQVITSGAGSIQLENLVPRGLHLTPDTNVGVLDVNTANYIGVNVTLTSTANDDLWEVTPAASHFSTAVSNFCGMDASAHPGENGVLFATVNDRYLVGLVTTLGLSSYSLRALYAFVFITVGYFVRSLFKFDLTDVFIYEIVNTEQLMNVCRALRLIRALDYPGKRRDEMKMYYALMRMVRESSLRAVLSRTADEF